MRTPHMNVVKSEGHHCFSEAWKNQTLPFDHELVIGNGTSSKQWNWYSYDKQKLTMCRI